MHTTQINDKIFLIDLHTGGFKGLFASYLIKCKKTVIIETGPSSSIPNLISALKETRINPEKVAYVALSHVHLDHGGGTGTLLKILPNAKVIVHSRGLLHLVNPEKLWQQSQLTLGNVAEIFGEPEPVPQSRIVVAKDGMEIDLGDGVTLRVIETLGHASHHLSYYIPLFSGVFPGDAAGIYVKEFQAVIPTSPPPFRLMSALSSLEKLIALKPKVLFYTHYGETLGAVKRLHNYSQQLNHWMKIVKDALKKNQKPSIIRERILTEDENMFKMAGFLTAHPIYSKTAIGNSIQGFIDSASTS